MTTSTPPAWKWLHECYVPVETPEPPDSATLRKRSGGGVEPEASCFTTSKLDTFPTGEDIWPLERAVSTNAIGTCCAPERDCTAHLTDSVSNAVPSHRIGTCCLDPDTGETVMPADFFGEKELRWTHTDAAPETTAPADSCVEYRHRSNFYGGYLLAGVTDPPQCPVCLHEMENDEGILCDHCGKPTGPGSFAVVNGPGGVFVYHLRCYDEVYWGEEGDDGAVKDTPPDCQANLAALMAEGYREMAEVCPKRETAPDEETPDVPFAVQQFMFESLCEVGLVKLHDLIDDHHDRILEMARDRFRKGFARYGSAMYSWTPKRRLDETLQELADAVVYPTSGSLE